MLQHVHAAKITDGIRRENLRWGRRHMRLLLIAGGECKTNGCESECARHTCFRAKTTVANASGKRIHKSKTERSVDWLHTALCARPVMPANWLIFADWVRLNRR